MQDRKKRKLPDDGTAREREPDIKKMCETLDGIESQLQDLRDEINRLRDRDEHKELQLAETQSLLVVDREQQLAEARKISVDDTCMGYSFSLTWMDQADGVEWAYKYSSLGTLDRVALEWMKEQDIRFGMPMCYVFFQQISYLIGQRA